MTKSAWIFPGQGSQSVGMGKDLSGASEQAASIFSTVDDALGFELSDIIFNGPDEALVSTRNQQPAILATSIAYLTVLQQRGVLPEPAFVAGHSLGEYTALVAAGALDLGDAARLVYRRGELMEEHGLGGMLAVIGLDQEILDTIASQTGVEIANYNAPGQTTMSGRSEALEQAAEMAKASKARRVIPLPVNGAFHSSLMEPVARELWSMIQETQFHAPSVPLIANVDARLLTNPDDLRNELRDQITASVRWIDVVEAAHREGVTRFFEVGPGKVLSGLVPRIAKGTEAITAEKLLAN